MNLIQILPFKFNAVSLLYLKAEINMIVKVPAKSLKPCPQAYPVRGYLEIFSSKIQKITFHQYKTSDIQKKIFDTIKEFALWLDL